MLDRALCSRPSIENVNGKEVTRLVRNDVYLLPARLDMSVDLELQEGAALRGHLRRARLSSRTFVSPVSSTSRDCASAPRMPDPISSTSGSRVGCCCRLSAGAQSSRSYASYFRGPRARARTGRTRGVSRHRDCNVDLAAATRRRIERVRIPHGGRRQPRRLDAAAREHDDAAAAFELAASVVPRRVSASRAHDHCAGLRCALAGARAQSLVSPGLE